MTREEQIIEASQIYAKHLQKPFVDGALWSDKHPQNLWHDAQGEDLPEINREVIVLCDIVLCDDCRGVYKVCFGHRPDKKGYLGKSLVTGNVETFYPHTYGKGGWNIPDVKWWCDINLPKGGGEE